MSKWFWGVLPLALLGALLAVFFIYGPLGVFQAAFPPVEELTIERAVLPEPDLIVLHVVNGGPESVTVAQVLVDDAFWQFTLEPASNTIPRLGKARIRIPYPWVEGEAHEIALLTSTGLTFEHTVEVATRSPQADWRYFSTFSLLGIYAGVIPVLLGLLFYPFLRDLNQRWIHFFLSLTVGLLVFLAVDTIHEALKTAGAVAPAFQGVALVFIGILGALLFLMFLSRNKPARADKNTVEGRQWTALMIAVGIGLHNLGEGLAIGSAYALGEIALGAFLVVGFTMHNLTEGLGIVAPIAKDRPTIARLVVLGLIAGLPTIVGTWIGGFAYSPVWSTLFLAVGAGAILQVTIELMQLFGRREPSFGLANGYNLAGFLLGLSVMYGTGLLVVA